MRKSLIAATLLLASPAMFVSCSKSEIEKSERDYEQEMENYLVGKWKLESISSRGGVYNPKYRLEGDFFITFGENGSADCSGDAKMHYYYEGESEFLTNNVSDFIHFTGWSVYYGEEAGYYLYTTTSPTVSPYRSFGLYKNEDGTITLSKMGFKSYSYSYTYYTFRRQ